MHKLMICMAIVAIIFATTSKQCHAKQAAQGDPQNVGRWQMLELVLSNSKEYANPFTDVILEGRFTGPSKREFKVNGFYDGDNTWRVRFMPDEVGDWSYKIRFSDGSPGKDGEFKCVKSKLHGPIRVNKDNPLWFEYADGTPFYPRTFYLRYLGHLDDKTLAETLDWLKAQGYNTINGPGNLPDRNHKPWAYGADGKYDFSRPNLILFKNFDKAIQMMADRGMFFIPFHIMGGTNSLPKIPTWKDQDLFLRNWIARWGGFWNASFQPISEWQEGWTTREVMRIGDRIRQLDEGRHIVSLHPLTQGNNMTIQQADWYDYHTVQDKLTDFDPIRFTYFADLYKKVQKPIFAHECLWEGCSYQKEAGLDMDNMRRGAWVIALSGGLTNYADRVVAPRRYHTSTDEGVTFSEVGMAMQPLGHFYKPMNIVFDFMESLPFQRMTLYPELSSSGMCLAELGHEYVTYTLDGGKITLDLSQAKGSLKARWFDTRTGKYGNSFSVDGGGKKEFTAPDENDWVLRITKS